MKDETKTAFRIEDKLAIFCDDHASCIPLYDGEFNVWIPLIEYNKRDLPVLRIIEELQKIGVKKFSNFGFEKEIFGDDPELTQTNFCFTIEL